jgi:hypothetical protein
MIAEIVCPKGGYTESRSLLPFTWDNHVSYSVRPLLPEQCGAELGDDDSGDYENDESSLGSVIVSELDDSSHGSVLMSEYNSNGSHGSHFVSEGSRSKRLGDGGNSNSNMGSVVVFEKSVVEQKTRSLSSVVVSEFSEGDILSTISIEKSLGMCQQMVSPTFANRVFESASTISPLIRLVSPK